MRTTANVVDSSGWLEYFGKGPNGEFFAPAIKTSAQLIVPTISIYEVYKRVRSQRDEEETLSVIAWMTLGLVVDLTREIALTAADLSLEYRLPMADSIFLATAFVHNATLWTEDSNFRGLPGVEYLER